MDERRASVMGGLGMGGWRMGVVAAAVLVGWAGVAWGQGADGGAGAGASAGAEVAPEEPALPEPLVIGEKAPAIEVESWVKGEPVSGFEAGTVYVVEFWATWCGPCRVSIPKLTAVQKEHGEKVVVVGVSIWERARRERDEAEYPRRVARFVEDMGAEMEYRVAYGGLDAVMARTWMEAGAREGIPSAFIVDQQGRLVWIGNPLQPTDRFEETLRDVVAGTFTEEEMREQAEKTAKNIAMIREARRLEYAFDRARTGGDMERALALIDEMVALDLERYGNASVFKMVELAKLKGAEAAFAYADGVAAGVAKDSPEVLNALAWAMLTSEELATRDVARAKAWATRANELTKGESADVLDTLAKALFDGGDKAGAIATQRKAIEKAEDPRMKAALEETLKTYEGGAGGSAGGGG